MFNAVLYCGEIETKKGQTITSCSSIDVLNLTKCCFDVMELICLMEQDFDTPDVRRSLSNFDPTKERRNYSTSMLIKEISLNRREKLHVHILTQEIKSYVRN
jgi:hypothetical protein